MKEECVEEIEPVGLKKKRLSMNPIKTIKIMHAILALESSEKILKKRTRNIVPYLKTTKTLVETEMI